VGVEEATIASFPIKACEVGGIYIVGGRGREDTNISSNQLPPLLL